jgi:hypothetical protein
LKESRHEGALLQLESLEHDLHFIFESGARIMQGELNKSTKATTHFHPISTFNQKWADMLLYVTAGLLDNITCF